MANNTPPITFGPMQVVIADERGKRWECRELHDKRNREILHPLERDAY